MMSDPWINNALHRILPVVIVVDWLVVPPVGRLRLERAAIWMVYPFAYMVYSLVRGPLVEWYPYPFFDPDKVGGYGGVAAYCAGMAVGFALVVWIVVQLGNRVRLSRQADG